jgi:hypothetical protein
MQHKKHRMKNTVFLNIKAGVTYSNHYALKG